MKKQSMRDILVIGLALFSMFFGAGNIIFPPYLGLESGTAWLTGFISYYLADIGLAILAIFAILKYNGSVSKLMGHIGKVPGEIMLSAIVICIGPLIAVPRTGATTYEMFVVPLFGEIGSTIPILIFFSVVFLLSVRESSVVDILGKFLTPVLFLGLLILIIKGIISPVGSIMDTFRTGSVVMNGVSAGYQTMDALAGVVFGMIVVSTIHQKGYLSHKKSYQIASYASILAALGLLLVYGGLTYLGATASGNMNGRLLRTDLILYITRELLGYYGVILLGVVVTLACITTAVALISSSADHFCTLSGKKIKYPWLVAGLCVFSAAVATLGTDKIVAFASPILSLLYPGMLTLIVLCFFDKQINDYIIRGAVIGASIASLFEILHNWNLPFDFISRMPLWELGFAWILPAVVGGIIGGLCNIWRIKILHK